MRIAIIHPFFISNGGGERVIDALAGLYPSAHFFALIVDQKTLSPALKGRNIRSTFLSRIPGAARRYQQLMPLYPVAAADFDVAGYDLVISSGGPGTKGAVISQSAKHIHYCHSPVRFLWDQYPVWKKRLPSLIRPLFAIAAHYNREWDFTSAQRVDQFVANSNYVSERIHTYYRRESEVIYPPVDTSKGYISADREPYYLCVSRLVPGKRIELLIDACNSMRRQLVIVGDGPERKTLASGATQYVRFTGRVDDAQLSTLYAKARAFLFASEEDFGIATVEAQSYGLPVISYGKGGSAETVIDADSNTVDTPTGVLFPDQNSDSVCEAIAKFEAIERDFSAINIQRHARQFDTAVFSSKMQALVNRVMSTGAGSPSSKGRTNGSAMQEPLQSIEISKSRA
jgi:glycosyltransferase involved in cell wall biosynthesis